MNIEDLFHMQQKLDNHIEKQHPRQEGEDRLGKKILSFDVELKELANEARFFKFWSNNQKPRTKQICELCNGTGHEIYSVEYSCFKCNGQGIIEGKNPLLEEFSDGFHFLLSIGNELGIKVAISVSRKQKDLTEQFMEISYKAYCLYRGDKHAYVDLFGLYKGLGEMLGFTREQVEQAYITKNQTNHQRQDTGY